MTGTVQTDEHGRITIPERLREQYGDRYRLVELRDGIKLVPIPDDPVAALRSAASEELREASLDELRSAAHDRFGECDGGD
ncbi:MAG: AbrB/MazE/SpoVT family DNA-binding domain-containing protein [Halobaculum sp.]